MTQPGGRAAGDGGWIPVTRDIRVAGGVVTKRATTGRDKLLREAAWLRAVPARLADRFPRVLAVRSGEGWAEYDMEYRPWPNFAEEILAGRIDEGAAVARTRAIVEFLFAELYAGPRRPAPPGFFRASYLDKLRRRFHAARGLSARLTALIDADALVIDGAPCRSPLALVRWIEGRPSLLARLEPPCVGTFHGDLKPDNILLDPESDRFLLLDPRGSTAAGDPDSDPIEDIAKLRTSTRSLYDVIRAGGCEVVVEGASVRRRLAGHARRAAASLRAMDGALLEWMPALAAGREDSGWALRLSFLLPLLLLANAPFQLAPPLERTEDIALLLFAEGAVRLEQAVTAVEQGRDGDGALTPGGADL